MAAVFIFWHHKRKREAHKTMRLLISLIILLAAQTLGSSLAPWAEGVEVGLLDPIINEASGIEVSTRYSNRLYHINDSGDTGRFFVTNFTGADAQRVRVLGFNPRDVEDLSLGPCGQPEDCLFLADIGDNDRERPWIEIAVVRELRDFPAEVRPLALLRLRYPDRAYDAESLAVHPDGTIYLLTKQGQGNKGRPGTPRLHRIPTTWWKGQPAPETLEFVTEIDLEKIASNIPASARLPTAMDISPDGKRVLILNYINAIELAFDFSQPVPAADGWREGRDYQRISLINLNQQEAIAYLPDGNALVYDTESRGSAAGRGRLVQVKRLTQKEPGVPTR
jgi:hypothetical protein